MAEPADLSPLTSAVTNKWSLWRIHGPIITATQYLQDGTLLIRDGKIESIFPTRTEGPEPFVDAKAQKLLVIPGLIDLHNHPAYNYYPQWNPPTKSVSRFDWRGRNRNGVWINPSADPFYRNCVAPVFKKVMEHNCSSDSEKSTREAALTAYGQIRGLVGGCTTMLTDCDLDPDSAMAVSRQLGRLVRTEAWLPTSQRVWAVLDVPCLDTPSKDPSTFTNRMKKDLESGNVRFSLGCLVVHTSEGFDNQSRGEFWILRDRGLVTSRTALIHSLGLHTSDWKFAAEQSASLVWSPTSNIRLYGRSLDIAFISSLGINICLAPDWTITGSSSIIDELAFVRDNYHRAFSPKEMLNLVTRNPGRFLSGADNQLGVIAPGAVADLVFLSVPEIPSSETEAYDVALKNASVNNVHTVVVGGNVVLTSLDDIKGGESISFIGENDCALTRRLIFPSPVARATSLEQLEKEISNSLAVATEGKIPMAPIWEPLNLY